MANLFPSFHVCFVSTNCGRFQILYGFTAVKMDHYPFFNKKKLIPILINIEIHNLSYPFDAIYSKHPNRNWCRSHVHRFLELKVSRFPQMHHASAELHQWLWYLLLNVKNNGVYHIWLNYLCAFIILLYICRHYECYIFAMHAKSYFIIHWSCGLFGGFLFFIFLMTPVMKSHGLRTIGGAIN